MRLTSVVILFLMVSAITVFAAKNGKKKKNRKSNKRPPQWKPKSMPVLGKRYEMRDEGDTITLDCRAKGKPRPKVTWFHNGRPLSDSDSVLIKRSGELTLEGVTQDKSGNYTCLVENSQGNLEWNFKLDVQKIVPDLKLTGLQNMTAMTGARAVFTCRVDNDPSATIRWYKGKGKPTKSDFLPPGPKKGTLTLNDITSADEGFYGCQASTLFKSKTKEAYLQVIDRPIRTTDSPVTVVPWYPDMYGPDLYPTRHDPFSTINPNGHGSRVDGDSMYFTTKKPRHRNGNKKNKDRKNRRKNKNNKKNKGQPKYDFDNFGDNQDGEDVFTFTTEKSRPMMNTPPPTVPIFQGVTPKPTDPILWEYDKDKIKPNGHTEDDMNTDDRLKTHRNKENKKKSHSDEDVPGSISSWTIYTIVGAVGGVVLLIGLVAITLTLCCRRDDEGVYKSTSV